jgi:DNA-directed RNA polymerase specialized sigma24 family protein
MTDTWDECVAQINALPAEERLAMSLRYEQGLNSKEIAAVLGWTPLKVYDTLNNAIRKCQPVLTQ